MDLQQLTASELVDRHADVAAQGGYAKGIKNGGMIASSRISLEGIRIELLRRLGVIESPEVTNRAAFIWLAVQRKNAACAECHAEPGGGRALNFWTKDRHEPDPLLLMMAWGGASVEKLKETKGETLPLCRRCAKQRGARLLKNGNVDLKRYL